MHLILTGATGVVGSSVLQHCLASSSITKLSILSRRDFDIAAFAGPAFVPHVGKARVIVHTDYTSYPQDLLDQLQGAKGVIWAQGISQFSVNERYVQGEIVERYTDELLKLVISEYIHITYESPMAAAKAFANLNGEQSFIFVHVSGHGCVLVFNWRQASRPDAYEESLKPRAPCFNGRSGAPSVGYWS